MRRLMILSISFATVTLLMTFIPELAASVSFYAVFAVLTTLAGLFFLLRKKGRKLYFLFLVCFGAVSAILSYRLCEFRIVEPYRQLDGTEQEISMYITEYPESGDGYTRICGRVPEGTFSGIQIMVYDNGRKYGLSDLEPGDIVRCTVKLTAADIRYGEKYYGLYASGIFMKGYAQDSVRVIGQLTGALNTLWLLPVRIGHAVSEIIGQVFAPRVASFMKSLLLNDRHDFYADSTMNRSMSDAGIMHIVAVSGMHIAFLVGVMHFILGNGRDSSVFCLLLIWFFVVMSGAPMSAVRAGFMQSLILCAPLFNRENDPPTALCFALLVILLRNPWAIRSVSLQLSFGAVAGLLLFSGNIYEDLAYLFHADHINGKHGAAKVFSRVCQYLIASVSSSVSVMVTTVPLCAYHFGTVQLLSVLTNALVLWAVSLCFCGGYLTVILFRVFPAAGRILAVPAALLAEHITGTAEFVSGIPYSVLYLSNTDSGPVIFLILVYIIFILLHYLKLPKFSRIAAPVLLSGILYCLFVTGTKVEYTLRGPVFQAIDVGQGQCLAVYDGENTVMIDCGSTMTLKNAGETAGKYLRSCMRDRVNLLVLTHLHTDHANGVETLLEYAEVDTILISIDDRDDTEFLPGIRKAAERYGTTIEYIYSDTEISTGGIDLKLFRDPDSNGTDSKSGSSTGNENCMICSVSAGGIDMLVTADVTKEQEQKFLQRTGLRDVGLLVIGHHGSKYASSEELLEVCRGATGIISVGYNNYGHPAEETLTAAGRYLTSVYRTDRDGTVQIFEKGETGLQWLKNRLKAAATELK